MARKTVYHKIVTEEKLAKVNKKNLELIEDFLDYLVSIDRSPKTIEVYRSDLNIFFVWNLEHNDNRYFIKLTKREILKFQNYCLRVLCWSPKRMRRVKSTLSSLSNYIENVLDEEEEFKNFRPIIKKIESPANEAVRKKTVLSDEQVETLLDTLVKNKDYEKACAIAIAAYSGMRKAELLQMKMEYFNEDHLFQGCLYMTDKIRAKGRGARGLQINKYILKKVDKYIDLWREQRKELGIESEWAFVAKINGKYEQRKTIDLWKNEFSEILGCDFYYHSLRHYLTSAMSAMNLPVEVIREFNSWGSIDMVSIYNDNSIVDDFGNYFSADGIIEQDKKKSISDMNK